MAKQAGSLDGYPSVCMFIYRNMAHECKQLETGLLGPDPVTFHNVEPSPPPKLAACLLVIDRLQIPDAIYLNISVVAPSSEKRTAGGE